MNETWQTDCHISAIFSRRNQKTTHKETAKLFAFKLEFPQENAFANWLDKPTRRFKITAIQTYCVMFDVRPPLMLVLMTNVCKLSNNLNFRNFLLNF